MRQTPCILTTFVWSLNRKTSISLYIFRYFYKNRRHRHPYFLHLGRKDKKKKKLGRYSNQYNITNTSSCSAYIYSGSVIMMETDADIIAIAWRCVLEENSSYSIAVRCVSRRENSTGHASNVLLLCRRRKNRSDPELLLWKSSVEVLLVERPSVSRAGWCFVIFHFKIIVSYIVILIYSLQFVFQVFLSFIDHSFLYFFGLLLAEKWSAVR